MKFQKLKEKLKKEGLFDLSRKKKIPQFPIKIALITSKNGSVIHDMIHRIQDRFPCEVIVCDVSIQGEKAASDIIKYVKNTYKLILTTGMYVSITLKFLTDRHLCYNY